MKSGQYLGSYAPYGYRKSEDDKHQLVIDEEAAAVVQRIFEMRRSGMAYGKITAALNQDGILSPRWYWAIHYGNGSCKCSKLWAYATVKNILNDAVYTGTLTQNRTGSRSYKDKTLIQKPESEWISHVDAHEAIISPETWDAVQEQNQLAKLRCADNAAPQPALFTGKLVCADCGHPLVVNRQTKRRKNGAVKKYVSYYCLQYANSGHSICSWHRISEITLQQLILNEIKAQAKAVTVNEAAVLEKLKKQVSSADTMRQENTRQEIASLRRRVQELEQMTAKLYEDKVSGTITEATFLMLIEKSEQERIQKSDRLDALLSEAGKVQQELSDLQKWTALIRKYLNLTELDRNTVDELIDRIEVSEATVVDGKRHQNIKIFYRFVGAV